MPTWRMPRPNRKRGPSGCALGLDRGEQIVDRLLLPALASEQLVAMVAQAEDVGGRVQPAELDELGDRLFSPSPSMSSAPRETKCRSRSKRCAGQIRPPVQRTSTSPSSATASLPHSGQWSGKT